MIRAGLAVNGEARRARSSMREWALLWRAEARVHGVEERMCLQRAIAWRQIAERQLISILREDPGSSGAHIPDEVGATPTPATISKAESGLGIRFGMSALAYHVPAPSVGREIKAKIAKALEYEPFVFRPVSSVEAADSFFCRVPVDLSRPSAASLARLNESDHGVLCAGGKTPLANAEKLNGGAR